MKPRIQLKNELERENEGKITNTWFTILNWFSITVQGKKTEKQLFELIDNFEFTLSCEQLNNKLLPFQKDFPSNAMLKRVLIRLEEKRKELEKIEIKENEKRIKQTIELRSSLKKRKENEEEERRISKLKKEYRDFQTYKIKFENGEYDEIINEEHK